MVRNATMSGSLRIAGSSSMSRRSGSHLATVARSAAHFGWLSQTMNFHASSGWAQPTAMLALAWLNRTGGLGMVAGGGPTTIAPVMAGLSPSTLAMAQ